MNTTVLEAEHLTKRYGDLIAVNDLSLTVAEGEVLGLLGPNGAGKTTTINMLVGLMKPDSGKVTYRGQQLSGEDQGTINRVGVCPQEIVLWKKLTCLEQLQFMGEMYGVGSQEARQRGKTLLGVLELSEKQDKCAGTLSGGMQRRLNLAMSLVHDPQVLVLDEPEAGLDPQSRVLVREYIQSLVHQKTIILTTHNMDEAERIAHRVAIIDQGRLLVMDTPDALKANVGEGDVVEINVSDGLPDKEGIRQALLSLAEDVSVNFTGNEIMVRARQIVNLLPALMRRLDAEGVDISGIHIRGNTLEDVFIQLTGRRLRQ